MAARKTSKLPTRIWRFPCRVESSLKDVDNILWEAHRYYNRLVEIERSRYDRYVAIRRAYAPDLAALEDRWDALDEAVADLYREAKRDRADHWRESGGERVRSLPPEYEARKAALVAERQAVSDQSKPLRAEFSELLAPARDEFKRRANERNAGRGPRSKSLVNTEVLAEMLAESEWAPAWTEIARSDDRAHDEQLAARRDSGLCGGTYLAVEEAFNRAKRDSAPRPPRFRRYDGEGKLQVQASKGDTWPAIHAGGHVTIESITSRTGSRRSNIYRITLDQGRGDRDVKVVATARLHRVPAKDAVVRWISIVVRRIGRETRTELQLTLEHASFDAPKRPAGQRSQEHVRLGWSRGKDGGGIVVARVAEGAITCPANVLDTQIYADSIEAAADRLRNDGTVRIRKILTFAGNRVDRRSWHRTDARTIAWLRRHAEDYARHVFGDDALRARWREWVRERRSRGEDLYAPMRVLRATMPSREAFAWWCWIWARKHAHMEQLAVYVRRKAIHRRDAHYRREAIRLATEYASLTIDRYSIAQLKELEALTMPGDGVRAMAQWQAQTAAPGRFREILMEVMGDRCSPSERPRDVQTPGTARARKDKAKRGSPQNAAGAKVANE